MTQPLRHIPSLDGLRAISFLVVFVAHCGLDRYVPGGFGVTIFFFLSGFLITTLMRGEFQHTGAVNFRHFWLRRAFRILPPFYIVLFAAIAVALIFDPPGTLSVAAVTAQLAHVTNYWLIYRGYAGQPAGTGVYWSLAVEEHFYLLFPWVFVAMQRLRLPPFKQALVLWTYVRAGFAVALRAGLSLSSPHGSNVYGDRYAPRFDLVRLCIGGVEESGAGRSPFE